MDVLSSPGLRMAADLLLTVGILKAGLITAALWLGIRLLPSWASDARALLWLLGCVALVVLPLVGWMRPVADLQVVAFPQGLFEGSGPEAAAPWLALAWIGGAAVLVGRFALHLVRARRMARRAGSTDDARLRGLLARARRRVRVARPVALALTPEVDTPALVGWRRPVVLLPDGAVDWPDQRILAVLCHELAHVRRGDYPWMVVAELLRAIYWPNPLVFLALREARIEQDKACDAAALGAGFRSAAYARHLVDVARSVRMGSAPTAAALRFLSRSRFSERISALLDRPREGATVSRMRRVALVGALVLLSATSALAATDLWICPGLG